MSKLAQKHNVEDLGLQIRFLSKDLSEIMPKVNKVLEAHGVFQENLGFYFEPGTDSEIAVFYIQNFIPLVPAYERIKEVLFPYAILDLKLMYPTVTRQTGETIVEHSFFEYHKGKLQDEAFHNSSADSINLSEESAEELHQLYSGYMASKYGIEDQASLAGRLEVSIEDATRLMFEGNRKSELWCRQLWARELTPIYYDQEIEEDRVEFSLDFWIYPNIDGFFLLDVGGQKYKVVP